MKSAEPMTAFREHDSSACISGIGVSGQRGSEGRGIGDGPGRWGPMNQFSVDSVRALKLMVQQWQNTNTPVRVIAEQIIDVYTGG